MEKRIKALYIITILAILIFLGMQVYWLFGRYEISLKEQEDNVFSAITTAIDEYLNSSYNNKRQDNKFNTQYTIHQNIGSTHKNFEAKITWLYRDKAFESVNTDSIYSKEDRSRMISDYFDNSSIYKTEIYNASNAPNEGEVWTSMKKVDVEFNNPLSSQSLDSILKNKGIIAKSQLFLTDSMIWKGSLDRHKSITNPSAIAYVPYSELEKKSAKIEFIIPATEILKDMWSTLAIVAFLSLFLIICLVLQFSTVLKLSRLDKMRNSFISTMIHELKRPISTLKMCVSGIENEQMMKNTDTKAELMSETRKALDSLSAYFSKLRDITFNNVEQIPLNIEIFNLHKLTDTVFSDIIIPTDKKANLINDIDPEIEVSADQSHLYNILANLVENAVKYSKESVEIVCSASKTDDAIEISVNDNGFGISSSDLKHIFKRFYRGKASASDQPGIGLGLTYVKLLVEAHGGDINVESTEGKGTCFVIRIPQ